MPKITVKSKGARFRRAGIEFTREGVDLDIGKMKREHLDAILVEPNLIVTGDVDAATGKALEVLLGSDKQPATIVIGDITAQLGDIVAIAFAASGATIDAWNAPDNDVERERLIQECVDSLTADPSIFQAYLDERAKNAKASKPSKSAKGKASK